MCRKYDSSVDTLATHDTTNRWLINTQIAHQYTNRRVPVPFRAACANKPTSGPEIGERAGFHAANFDMQTSGFRAAKNVFCAVLCTVSTLCKTHQYVPELSTKTGGGRLVCGCEITIPSTGPDARISRLLDSNHAGLSEHTSPMVRASGL